MKIAYILYPEVIVSNRSNGIRSQAEDWASFLETAGHQVDRISNWGDYNWKEYDVIHFFGLGEWVIDVATKIKHLNENLYFSPIVDPSWSFSARKEKIKRLISKLSCYRYKTNTQKGIPCFTAFKRVLVRSNAEKDFIMQYYNVPISKISLVPLSYSSSCRDYIPGKKDNFCLHISSIYQPRKNVLNLVQAAKKYGFNLVLAGNCGSESQFKPLKQAIGQATNIKVLGYISEDEKIALYNKAKVFALPSKMEGVGIVALDAAYFGCEIAITNIDGPKEYYNGMCLTIHPDNIDDIGIAIMKLLNGDVVYQPELRDFIVKKYSSHSITKTLIDCYTN